MGLKINVYVILFRLIAIFEFRMYTKYISKKKQFDTVNIIAIVDADVLTSDKNPFCLEYA